MNGMAGLAFAGGEPQAGGRPALVKQQAQCRDLVATVGGWREGSGGKRDGMLAQYCIRFYRGRIEVGQRVQAVSEVSRHHMVVVVGRWSVRRLPKSVVQILAGGSRADMEEAVI
jgi:hypothetical protein